MTWPRRRLVVTTLIALAATGCGVSGQARPTKVKETGVKVVDAAPVAAVPAGTQAQTIRLCFVAGDQLVETPRDLPSPASIGATLAALVAAQRKGGVPGGARSVVSEPDLVTARSVERGVAKVELGASFDQISTSSQILALAQVVCTLTNLPGVGQIQFTRNGVSLQVPRADSSLTNQPVARSDYAPLLPRSAR